MNFPGPSTGRSCKLDGRNLLLGKASILEKLFCQKEKYLREAYGNYIRINKHI
jgi:hypothetical protein